MSEPTARDRARPRPRGCRAASPAPRARRRHRPRRSRSRRPSSCCATAAGPRGAHDRASRPRVVRGRVGLPGRQARGRRPDAPSDDEEDAARRAGGARDAGGDRARDRARRPPHGLVLGSAARAARCGSARGSSRRAPATATLVLSPHEAVAAEWVRPEVLLERHGRGEVTLYPPTWVTLHGLAGSARCRGAPRRCCGSRGSGASRRSPGARSPGPLLLWQEDAEYDGAAAAGRGIRRHRLELGALPWVYTRSD